MERDGSQIDVSEIEQAVTGWPASFPMEEAFERLIKINSTIVQADDHAFNLTMDPQYAIKNLAREIKETNDKRKLIARELERYVLGLDD